MAMHTWFHRSSPSGRRARAATLTAVVAVGLLVAPTLPAQLVTPVPEGLSAEQAGSPTGQPPLTRVTLFTSGVAEFYHETRVTGDATLRLAVPEDQMSDVVRSLTVLDADGGSVWQIDHAAGESLADRLGRYRVDLSGVRTLTDLLAQIRGTAVSVQLSSGRRYSGSVLSAGTPSNSDRAEMVIAGEDGQLHRVAVDELAQLTLEDETLQREIDGALAVVAASAGTTTNTLVVTLTGSGERRVAVRYLREMPLWKTSYRAVLDGDEVILQGWAHVDNTSNLDWIDTELRLVSAAPETYFFDLYPPRYVSRRDGSIDGSTGGGAVARSLPSAPMRSMAFDEMAADSIESFAGSVRERTVTDQRLTGISFTVPEAVTIRRGSSSMVPLVNRRIPAETVRSFDPRRDGATPRLSLSFSNETGVQLPQGPMTIFDGDRYVGDGALSLTPRGAERTIPFARDLQLRVTADTSGGTEELRTIRIVEGMLVAERRARLETIYRIEPDGDAAGTVLPSVRISHPRRPGWQIVSPRSTEESPTTALFTSTGRSLTVVEEQIREQRYALTSMDETLLVEYSSNRLLEPRVRRILQNVIELREQVRGHEETRRSLEEERRQIFTDQERIRGNMAALDRNSTLYRRYVSDLESQESRLRFIESDLTEAREAEQQARDALTAYLATL
jgi:hypothetical protein